MLADTMGSPDAFELRREEITAEITAARGTHADLTTPDNDHVTDNERVTDNAHVTDEEVVESYLGSLSAGGLMRTYLQQAQLAVLINGTLCVHGAVNDSNFGVVPRVDERLGSVPAWVEALNKFARDEVAEWCAACDYGQAHQWQAGERWGGGRNFFSRPGGALLAYGMAHQPGGARSATVV